MAVSGSLQLSSFLGFCGNQHQSKHLKCVTGRGKHQIQIQIRATDFSSCASRQDLWSHRLSTSVNRPLCSLPYRSNLLRCNSVHLFGQNVSIPTVKAATGALVRSCNAFQGSPLLPKLLPPVAIVVFTLLGLQPLLMLSRKVFARKSDSSWKKSVTNYVMTSYLQPILLWTAAILICRTLDPIAMPTESSQLVKQRLLNFVKSLSTVVALAFCLSSGIQQAQKYFMETNDPSDSSNMGFQFAGKAVYSAVWVAAASLFMELLGFSTQKWLTAGGLGTVLLTLAGREIFTNFLSSIMIHATRPFVVNEWIQTKIEGYEVSGTVEHVGWWSPTIIRGEDREAVHIPNHKFTVNVVRNLTQKTHWRVKTHLAISHLDASKINNIVADMRKVLAKNPQVEHKRLHRRVFLENVDPENQALMILISCFVKTSHHEEYLCVKEGILLDLLRVIKHHRARLATPIRTIQKFYNEPDLGNISFSDFTRAGPASKTPILLIEPPYKINGEDRSRPQSMVEPISDSKDTKETSKPGNKAEVDVSGVTDLKTSDENKASKLDPKIDGKANTVKSTSISKPSIDSKSEDAQSKLNVESQGNDEKKGGDSQPKQVVSKLNTTLEDKASAVKSMASKSEDTRGKLNTENQGKDEKKGIPVGDSQSKHVADMKLDNKVNTVKSTSTPKPSLESKPEDTQAKANIENESNDEKIDISGGDSNSKHSDKSSSSALEENIVLGLALEGSKRTLPIEDELPPSSTPQEVKELAKQSNGSGSPSGEKYEKEN